MSDDKFLQSPQKYAQKDERDKEPDEEKQDTEDCRAHDGCKAEKDEKEAYEDAQEAHDRIEDGRFQERPFAVFVMDALPRGEKRAQKVGNGKEVIEKEKKILQYPLYVSVRPAVMPRKIVRQDQKEVHGFIIQ
jgi:hypothetical protein